MICRFIIISLACSLLSCASLQPRPHSYGCEMSGNSGIELLEKPAIDCGNASGNSIDEMRVAQKCAEQALKSRKSVRFALSEGAIDYFRCQAVIRRRDQTIWFLQWNLDLSFEPDDPGHGPYMIPQRCESVVFTQLTPDARGYFAPQNCQDDVEGYKILTGIASEPVPNSTSDRP